MRLLLSARVSLLFVGVLCLLPPAMSWTLRTLEMRGDAGSTSALVSSLLSRALSVTGLRNPPHDTGSSETFPAKIAFDAKQTQKIVLSDSASAVEYLSLPASNYSLLDSNIVRRDGSNTSAFFLTIPLSTAALPAGTTLQTCVVVDPDPTQRQVKMRSGPLTIGSTEEEEVEENDTASSLPEWLIWGGEKESDSREQQLSTQMGFDLCLSWAEPVGPTSPDTDVLTVDANVRVWVNVSVPLPARFASAVNNRIANIYLAQAGALTARAAIQSLAPTLAALLVKDHEARRLRKDAG